MTSLSSKYFSIRIAELFMKMTGFWTADTVKERCMRSIAFFYTIMATLIGVYLQSSGFYHSWGDVYAMTYTACNMMPIIIIVVKFSMLVLRQENVTQIIKYSQKNFWNKKYDDYGKTVLDDVNKKGIIFMCSLNFVVQGTVLTYILTPMIANLGKNQTERIFVFPIWIDLPTTTPPYFEIIFIIQTLALIQIGISFCAPDNFLAILCLHAIGQFKILQHRLKTIYNGHSPQTPTRFYSKNLKTDSIHCEFKRCIVQHYSLITYIEKLECIFSVNMLCQVLVSSIMICVASFQVATGKGSFVNRLIFVLYTNAGFLQLFTITIIVHDVITESYAVGDAVYNCMWESFPYSRNKRLRKDIILIIQRSMRPCCITAGGFSSVSRETFMKVLSTAASYFT